MSVQEIEAAIAQLPRGEVAELVVRLQKYGLKDKASEDLAAAYRDMASDEAREHEALEWAEATVGDAH